MPSSSKYLGLENYQNPFPSTLHCSSSETDRKPEQNRIKPDLLGEKAIPAMARHALGPPLVEGAYHEQPIPKVPFYRTGKGILIIFVALVIHHCGGCGRRCRGFEEETDTSSYARFSHDLDNYR
jgi:hypothetical protein